MDPIPVLTAGHVNWDVTLRVDRLPQPDGEASIRSQRQSGGGSAANVAAALAGLDVDTGLIGSVGDDDNGLLAHRELEAAGISLAGVRVVEGPKRPSSISSSTTRARSRSSATTASTKRSRRTISSRIEFGQPNTSTSRDNDPTPPPRSLGSPARPAVRSVSIPAADSPTGSTARPWRWPTSSS